jgi:nitrogen fixation/metabolism regulation signal transduction histidine kinase
MMKHKLFRRRKKIIKPRYQLKLAFVVVTFLLIYSLIFGAAIFCPLAIELRAAPSLEDQARVAFVVLGLHETIWPALFFILVLAFIGTILSSHRVVGPIYRLEKAIGQFVSGNFKERIWLRKTDEFKEIETMANRLAEYLENAKSSDSRFHTDLREKLSTLSAMLETEGLPRGGDAGKMVDELIVRLDSKPDAFAGDEDE